MSLEPIGLATLLVGLLCLALGYRASVAAMIVATLLGSAAAVLVGSANIQPAHLLLGFVAIAALTRRREARAALRALSPEAPGFWLLCLVAYGVAGGALLPRLLAGLTPIVPVGTSAIYGATDSTIPLGPVSGNLTQAIYLSADLLCFAIVAATAASARGFTAVTNALLATAAANVVFAGLDLATYATDTQALLEPIRNAQYAFHLSEEAEGLKRVAGSFTEASAFAHASLGALGFTGTLWLCGRRAALSGPLALISLGLIVLSTSSTGLVGIPPLAVLLYATAIRRCSRSRDGRNSAAFVIGVPIAALVGGLAVALDTAAWTTIRDYLTALVFQKGESQSGIERAAWNAAAWHNFVDTYGVGIGLGTGRASSFALAILSNLGVFGAIAYGLFVATAFRTRTGRARSYEADVRLAARNACIGLLVADVISGALVDQGLIFYVMAALACATPLPDRRLQATSALHPETVTA